MRQLVAALGLSDFTEFGREADEIRQVVTMVEYENTFPFPVLFSSEMPSAVLAEVLSEAHLLQFLEFRTPITLCVQMRTRL